MTVRSIFTNEISPASFLGKLFIPGVVTTVIGVVYAFFRLLESQPKEAIDLLSRWGPGFLITVIVIAVIGGLLSQGIDIARDGVNAQKSMAEAITRISEKDDRQLAEIRTLATFSAQESERTHDRLKELKTEVSENSKRMQNVESLLVDLIGRMSLAEDGQEVNGEQRRTDTGS